MLNKVTNPSPAAAWLAAPELRESLLRIARDEQSAEDVERLTTAAPPELRALTPFFARVVRLVRVLQETRARATERARALVDRAHATHDSRAGFDACLLIARHGLLDEPPTPRLVGSAAEPGYPLEIDSDEVVLTDAIVPVHGFLRARIGLVVAASVVPSPAPLDEATEEQMADAIADAFCQQEGL